MQWSGVRATARTASSSRRRASCPAAGWTSVLVDAETGEVVERLTEDRAGDVEPAWTPDGTHLVFRSDRDGVPTSTRSASRTTRCCAPPTCWAARSRRTWIRADGAVVFANYTSSGYDLHRARLDLGALPPAEPFDDPYPDVRPLPLPADGPSRPYRPFPTALPRFWGALHRDPRRRVALGRRHRRHRSAAEARVRCGRALRDGDGAGLEPVLLPVRPVPAHVRAEPPAGVRPRGAGAPAHARGDGQRVAARRPHAALLAHALSLSWKRSREDTFGARCRRGWTWAGWERPGAGRTPSAIPTRSRPWTAPGCASRTCRR